MTDHERFAALVVCDLATRCWIWTGTVGGERMPRGQFWVDGHMVTAARYAWEEAYGPVPEGLMVLHKPRCSSAMCVLPTHLYVGTQFDNMRDRMEAGNYATRPKL